MTVFDFPGIQEHRFSSQLRVVLNLEVRFAPMNVYPAALTARTGRLPTNCFLNSLIGVLRPLILFELQK
jgi:hypothetical protein